MGKICLLCGQQLPFLPHSWAGILHWWASPGHRKRAEGQPVWGGAPGQPILDRAAGQAVRVDLDFKGTSLKEKVYEHLEAVAAPCVFCNLTIKLLDPELLNPKP